MSATLAIVALLLIFFVAIIQFGNELYYRKRVSMLGMIVFLSSIYLMFYLHELNEDILELVQQLSQYQIVKLPKGE